MTTNRSVVLPKRVLTIAGSDSGAGAGIQADLKTFAALGVYGCSAITAVTAQNTRAVTAALEVPAELVAAQIDAVVEDIGADAVKTGMLANADIVAVVAAKVREHGLANLVVDPVLAAESGYPLLRPEALAVLKERLLPLATVVTPNWPEAEALVGRSLTSDGEAREAAVEIRALGPRCVVIKGGHREGAATDLFYDGREFQALAAPRLEGDGAHGTGCTFAAAIAALLALGLPPAEAVARAKDYVTGSLRHALPLGRGRRPLHHFYRFWEEGPHGPA